VYAANTIRRTVEVEVETNVPAHRDKLAPGQRHPAPRTSDNPNDKMNDVILAAKYGVSPADVKLRRERDEYHARRSGSRD
jgi:hypothetical protein